MDFQESFNKLLCAGGSFQSDIMLEAFFIKHISGWIIRQILTWFSFVKHTHTTVPTLALRQSLSTSLTRLIPSKWVHTFPTPSFTFCFYQSSSASSHPIISRYPCPHIPTPLILRVIKLYSVNLPTWGFCWLSTKSSPLPWQLDNEQCSTFRTERTTLGLI